eukprot:15452186-Alexandrium_andersonii.AAC.1
MRATIWNPLIRNPAIRSPAHHYGLLASLHRRVPKLQSAIRPRPVRAQIRLNPQSTLRKMRTRFRRSNLELPGTRSSLKIGPRISRG